MIALQILCCSANTFALLYNNAEESSGFKDVNEGDETISKNYIDFYIQDILVVHKKNNNELKDVLSEFKEPCFSEFHPDICIPPPKS